MIKGMIWSSIQGLLADGRDTDYSISLREHHKTPNYQVAVGLALKENWRHTL